MKVLFIYPDLFEFIPGFPGTYYVGVGSLAAVVKRAGHQASLIHLLRPWKDRSEFLRRVETEQPDLMAFSSTTLQFGVVRQMAGWLQESGSRVPTLCGGVHPTISPEEAIATPGIDFICRGEGEGAILELCEHLARGQDPSPIHNLWVKANGAITRNPLRPLQDLDALPDPDREIFPNYPNLWWERNGTASVMASRGCPFNCNYCCNKILRQVHPDGARSVRFRSPAGVIAEIRGIRERFPFVRSLNFDDDILFLRKDWSAEFLSLYRKEVALPFHCNVRPGRLDPGLVREMRESGCREVRLGLESGSDRVRNRVLNRHISREQITEALSLFRRHGIHVRTFNMVGIPDEYPRDVLETIKMNAELGVLDPQVTIFYPFPGTELFEICRRNGFLTDRELVDYYYDTALSLPTLSAGQILMFHHYFDRFLKMYAFVFRLPGPVSGPLSALLDGFLTHPRTPLLARALRRGIHLLRPAASPTGRG